MQRHAPQLRHLAACARVLAAPLLVGLVLAGLQLAAMFDEPPAISFVLCGGMVVLVLAIGWGVHAISAALDRAWPWRRGIASRVLLQGGLGLVLASVVLLSIYVPSKLAEIAAGADDALGWPHVALTWLIALLIGGVLSALQLLFDLLGQWREAERDAARQRQAALTAELAALKAQLNPHFLFNSLNLLYGLIDADPAQARTLLLELSDVFRYVLRHGPHDRVPLADELAFVDAYLAVIRARHRGQPSLDCADLGDVHAVALPPMSLQVVIENVVRHNRIDSDAGMRIALRREADALVVANPLRPRRGDSSGAGTGLAQLDARFRLLGDAALRIERDAGEFRVVLPLLPCAS